MYKFYKNSVKTLAVILGVLSFSSFSFSQTCTRVVSNAISCNFNKAYVIYLMDKNGSHHHLKGDTTQYQWLETGTDVRFIATGLSASGLDGTFDVDLTFSGRTTTPPTNSPKEGGCFTISDTSGWVYFPTTTGTIVSTDYGTMTITRRGESFQIGTDANVTMKGYGASAWFNVSGGTGEFGLGDINVMLAEDCKPGPPPCERIVSNAISCNFNKAYVVYFKDSNGSHHHLKGDTSNYQWIETDDAVRFIADDISAPGLNGTFDIDITFSGRTKTPPTNSPKTSTCFTIGDTTDWEYFPITTGTITSTHYGTMTITRRGEAFQLGTNANITMAGFGASGWLDISGGTGGFLLADVNVMLSALGDCPDTTDIKTCKNTSINFCINDLFDLDSLFNGDITIKTIEETTNHGITSVLGNDQGNSDQGCCDAGKPTGFTFKYVASNITNNSQTGGKSSVTTYTAPAGQRVLIVANESSTASDTSSSFFRWEVNAGEEITMDNSISTWKSNTYFHILDSTGKNVLQLVQFHTSCSAPIIPGDQFGTLLLVSSSIDGVVCGGDEECIANVVYFPEIDFIGIDTISIEVCYMVSGNKVCEDLLVSIEVEADDSFCPAICPENMVPTYVESTSSGILKAKAHDKDKGIGAPDGDFAKLEHKGEYITLALETILKAGDTLEVVIASYDDNLASGTIEGSEDGINFGPPTAISTSTKKPSTETKEIRFWTNTQFIRIKLDDDTKAKLLIDGIRYKGIFCKPDIQLELELNTCKNTSITICIDDLANLDSIFNSNVSVGTDPVSSTNGYSVFQTSNSSSDQGCCDAGKPTGFTFKYVASNVTDNSQDGSKSSVTTYTAPAGQRVLIVANGSSSASDTSNSYFRWTVNANELITLDKAISSWASNTYFHIMDSTGTNVLQLVQFHTSCSAPIIPGDQFGNLILMSSSLDGVVCGSSGECTNTITYFPEYNYSGKDTVEMNVCMDFNGVEYCEVIDVVITIKDSSCSPVVDCPVDYDIKTTTGTSVGQTNNSVTDAANAVGEPDGSFAKLDNGNDYLILALPMWIEPGNDLDLVIASYDGALAKGTVEGSADGVNFGAPIAISTSKRKPLTNTRTVQFDNYVQFVRIKYNTACSGKLMIDGLEYEGAVCQPNLEIEIEVNTCKNTPLSFCLDDKINLDSLFGTTVTAKTFSASTNNGQVTLEGVTSSGDQGCCDAGKPTGFTFKYVATNVTDNSQDGSKSSVTTYTAPAGQRVLIVANGSSSASDTSNSYFRWTVNANEVITLDKSISTWGSNTYFHIMDSTGSTALQLVQFHTSCSAPIVPGDQFGTLVLQSSSLDGVVCGSSGECTKTMTYFPDINFSGTDTITFDVCFQDNGNEVCDQVDIIVHVADSVCNPFCPEGFIPVKVSSTSSGILKATAHDKQKGVGSPDGQFAKLEHNDEYITLALDALLAPGDSINVVIASYGGDLAKATIAGSEDGINFTTPQDVSTSTKKPSTETKSFKFLANVQFVRIQRASDTKDKFLVDGVYFEGVICRPELPKKINLQTCVDDPLTWNVGEILPDGASPRNWTVEINQNPTKGSLSLTDSYSLSGCALDKPKKLTMRYTGGDCSTSDNSQGGDFKCDDKKDISAYTSVYIVVNDNKEEKERTKDNDQYFNGVVSVGDVVAIDAALNSKNSLPGKIYVWIMNPSDNKVIQKMEIKTDCNKPINIYDEFGALLLTKYTAKDGNGEVSEVSELFEATYTPNASFMGLDSLKINVCSINGDSFCQEVTYLIQVGSDKPVATNDTADELKVVAGLSSTFIDILANDYHPTGDPFTLQWPLLIGPTLSGATVTYDSVLGGVYYNISDPVKGDLDSFQYVIETLCSKDTAKVYIKFGEALPVEFISFTAELVGRNNVELNWLTGSEVNNSHFEIERAFGNGNYHTIGAPIQGAGTTTEIQYYDAFDSDLPNGVAYYRIKQIDFDGKYEYSEVRFVNIQNSNDMRVYPNPSSDVVHVYYAAGRNKEVLLTNLAGQVIDRFELSSSGDVSFNTINYPQGVYFLKVSGYDTTAIQKIVLQK